MTQPHTWSPEQSAIFAALGSANLFVRACAGSGKTTTIVECCRRVPQPARVVFLAFNKGIAETLAERMPYYAVASTFHSYCLTALRRAGLAKGKPDGRKCAALLRRLVPTAGSRREWEDDALSLVSLAKSIGWGYIEAADAAVLRDLADRHGLALDNSHLGHCQTVLELSAEDTTVLDFDDMLLFALDSRISFDHCNYLFVDEEQDTNAVQRALLRRMLPPGAWLVAVGDPSQSIYGFRGADSDACAALVRDFAMIELPLSVTYRCSQAVAAEARKFEQGAPLLESTLDPDAEGELFDGDPQDYGDN